MYQALLLDVGYVIIDISWPAVEAYDAAIGTGLPGASPADPEQDARWQQHRAGQITPDQYWDEVARAKGLAGFTALFRAVADVVPDAMIDRDAVALMRDASSAGRRVGALSNDAYTFLGSRFFARRPEFAALDAFVDATEVGARKPEPDAYLAAAKALDVPPEAVVFLDDTPACVEGARSVGMTGIRVDPFDRRTAFDQARGLLGLTAG